MALGINTNMYAQFAQRALRKSEAPLQQSMQRLSTGLRVNSAKDDAAGMAIGTRMTRQINGLTVAMRNSNDGVSFAQTAEGAMDEMLNSLQRIYTLANQAASYNTSTDRSSMNLEVSQLVSELNRVVSQTRFNGEKFLNQSFSANFQVGTEVNESMNITTTNVSPDAFGVQATKADFSDNDVNRQAIASAIAGMSIRGAGLSANATLYSQDLGDAIAASDAKNNSQVIINRVNQYTALTGVTAFSFGNSAVSTANLQSTAGGAVNSGYITINGISIASTTAAGTANGALASVMVTAINAKSTQTGVYAVVLGSADTGASSTYGIALVNTTGAAISVSVATANAGLASGNAAFFGTTAKSISAGQNGQIIFSTPLGQTSKGTEGASTALALGFGSASATISITNSKSVNDANISNAAGASLAILAVEQGLETLNTEKSKLGAILNRFDSTIRNLDNVRENITAARSRIMDADYAEETANMTKAQITQQAGISVLSQAKDLPQAILSLLGGR